MGERERERGREKAVLKAGPGYDLTCRAASDNWSELCTKLPVITTIIPYRCVHVEEGAARSTHIYI